MPLSPPRCCPCGGLIRQGKCDKCGHYKGKHTKKTTERGLGWDWQQLVEQRKADPDTTLCHDCLAKGIVRTATERHHLIRRTVAPHLRLEPSNIMDLCEPCHKKRTARGE